MVEPLFDDHASEYDAWFIENANILESEVRLIAHAVGKHPGRTLSVGCGTGLFELKLREEHGIVIHDGIEPSDDMAAIARKRGMSVQRGVAEELPADDGSFDTVLQNGTPGYTKNLRKAFEEAFRVLVPGGRIVVADVPAESSYGLLYRLAGELGSYEDPKLVGSTPALPYPLELAAAANWRTTESKRDLLVEVGFEDASFYQTLTKHPRFSNEAPEDPVEGYDRGDYVAMVATKPAGR